MSEPETCALPLGFTDRMRRLLGAEYPAFLASYDKPRRPALRVNPLRLDGIPDGVRAPLPCGARTLHGGRLVLSRRPRPASRQTPVP